MITLNLQTVTPAEIAQFKLQHRLNRNESTVLDALHSVELFLVAKNFYYIVRNLEDALSYASPRVRGMKRSVRDHLAVAQSLSIGQHRVLLAEHMAAFCKGVTV